jgi:hypothetical protein
MVLEGKKNIEAAVKQINGKKRQPVTPEIMSLLKARIREWNAGNLDKLTVWAVSSLLFHGAFRSGELLAKNIAFFDPAYTLLRQDILITESETSEPVVQILVKSPKESKNGSSSVIDIFKTDTEMCPMRAVEKWWKASRHMEPDQPAFRLSCGSALTGAKFNSLLHGWLADSVPGISRHSFRIGAASLMGKLGYSDKDIKAIGRWGSNAFEGYIRLPRTKRRLVAEKLAKYGHK